VRGGVKPTYVVLLPRSGQDIRRREDDVPINEIVYPHGRIKNVGALKSGSCERSAASMIGLIERWGAYAQAIMLPCLLETR
jgi:hypothetical protein